jgi:hypothetical protein
MSDAIICSDIDRPPNKIMPNSNGNTVDKKVLFEQAVADLKVMEEKLKEATKRNRKAIEDSGEFPCLLSSFLPVNHG